MLIPVSIPLNAKCLLNINQKVDFNTPFLDIKTYQETVISVSNKLNIAPTKIFKYLLKFVGDQIKPGEIIAKKKGLFGGDELRCDIPGIIKEIDHTSGSIIVSSNTESKIINAYFTGEITEIKNNQLMLKTKTKSEFPIKSVSGNFGGRTLIYKNQSSLTSDHLAQNHVLVIDSLTTYIKTKTEVLGIKGFITLMKPSGKNNLPYAQIKLIDDFAKIKNLNDIYCLVNIDYNMVYFYS